MSIPQIIATVTLFGTPTLPQPSVHQVILVIVDRDTEEYPLNGIDDKDDQNIFYLEEAMAIPHGEEPAFDDFAAALASWVAFGGRELKFHKFKYSKIYALIEGGLAL